MTRAVSSEELYRQQGLEDQAGPKKVDWTNLSALEVVKKTTSEDEKGVDVHCFLHA